MFQNTRRKTFTNWPFVWRFLLGLGMGFGLFLMPTAVTPPVVLAQSDSSYWQFSLTHPISQMEIMDLDHNGIQEILITSEAGELILVGANGLPIWQFQSPSPILATGVANVNGIESDKDEIVIAHPDSLRLLSADGEEIWQHSIKSIQPPLALLSATGEDSFEEWQTHFQSSPIDIQVIDQNQDGRDEIIVLFDSGQVQLIDGDGFVVWDYTRNSTPGQDAAPILAVDDLNKDGKEEIVLTTFRRFTLLTVLDENGRLLWDQPLGISGKVTALTLVDFPQLAGVSIAVGTDKGNLNLYNVARQRVWPRTLNVPITSLTINEFRDEPNLIVGTAVGTISAYNWEGKRVWKIRLDDSATRPIVSISSLLPNPLDERQPSMSVVVGNSPNVAILQDVVLLSENGRVLNTIPNIDSIGLTKISDINQDTNSELLLAQFAHIELVGIGIGASETTSEWRRSVNATPQSFLTIDLDSDGNEELLIGTQNGRVHCFQDDASLCWLHAPGGNITHLAQLDTISGFPPNIVVARRVLSNEINDRETLESLLEVWQPNGDRIWSEKIDGTITAVLVKNINDRNQPEIIIGTQDGEIIVFSSNQTKLWSFSLPQPSETSSFSRRIMQLFVMTNNYTGDLEILAVTPQVLFKVNEMQFSKPIWRYENATIQQTYVLDQPNDELATRIISLLDDGSIRGHHWDGIQLPQWPIQLPGNIISSQAANDIIIEAFQDSPSTSFLISTESDDVIKLDLQDNMPSLAWQLSNLQNVTDFYWGDLDGDSLPDMAVGLDNNSIQLFTNNAEEPIFTNELGLSGRIFALEGLKRLQNQSDLIAITTNGEVELFKAQENRPPLLTDPQVERTNEGYDFTVSVTDIENDIVEVGLEVLNPAASSGWELLGTRTTNGNPVVWAGVELPADDSFQYRFTYSDGIYSGNIAPQSMSTALIPTATNITTPYLGALVGLATLTFAFLFLRQTQLPDAKAARFYRSLKRNPKLTYRKIERRYIQVGGSEDFLLNLARQARQNRDDLIANFADGLYLLPERPIVGLPIILTAIEAAEKKSPEWIDHKRWSTIFKTALALLEAPSITELALLRPRLVQLLNILEELQAWSPALESLLPVATSIRDSQRVDQPDDKLVYLNEGAYYLKELNFNLPEFSDRIEKTLTAVLSRRWSGLITAEIQELRGRAELILTLKTRRLVPSETISIVLKIENNGRSNAEDITVALNPDPAYEIIKSSELLSILPSGRSAEIHFTIRPLVSDRFRISVNATFNDQIRTKQNVLFADMVHLLPPVKAFTSISNPYLPGTPLRPGSNIFFGRDQLFNFIADNAAGWAQRNVLILIGQRRTGKTSTLLRLGERLPEHLLPVYIDCQSLGIVPGMANLFHEIAWLISDTLLNRNIEITVPEIEEWQADPRTMFQRRFIPQVRSLLPPGTMILFVFDEFEAFENLVNDNILPPTFFTYLRHLMQHSDGLSFLFVGTRRLEEMSTDYWSILFNIALYERIHYLSFRSTMRLISEPVAPHIIYDDLALDKIWRVTAGHPYFLQLVCYTLIKQANDNQNAYITISDVNTGLDEMLNLGEVHFAYIWQRSSFAEKAMLTAVAHLMSQDVAFHPEDLVAFLQPYNIHFTPAEVTNALTRLVERDILKEISPDVSIQYELKVGLVGLWVAKHKSLSKLQAKSLDETPHPMSRRLKSKEKMS